jgi:hypothetical protein
MVQFAMSGPRSRALFWSAAIAAFAILLAPALWNGFALLYPDTGGYLARPIEHTLELNRSALYGAFLYAGVPFAFWPAIAVQAALGIWLVALTLRVFGLLRPLTLLGMTLALAVATSLPWYADMLTPDIWLPYAVLALYLLAFHTCELRRTEIAGLVALIAFALASHTATLVLVIGLIATLSIASLLTPLPPAQLRYPFIATAAGVLLALASNFIIAGQFAFTPGGPTFLFARLLEDGLVKRYLAAHCPDPALRICAFRDRLEDNVDDWLFAPGNILGQLGGWRAFEPEARRLSLAILKTYPGAKAAASLTASAQQFAKVKTEVSLNRDYTAPVLEALEQLTPQLMPRVLAARQQAAIPDFVTKLAALNVLHVTIAAISILGLATALFLPHRIAIAPPLRAFVFTVFVALAGNAAICGTFSTAVDRYQSRLVWLAPLALLVIGLARRRASR